MLTAMIGLSLVTCSWPPANDEELSKLPPGGYHRCWRVSIPTVHATLLYSKSKSKKEAEQAAQTPTFEVSTDHILCFRLRNDCNKVGRRWGQRHPQGANLGSNGILRVPVQESHTSCHHPSLHPLPDSVLMPGSPCRQCRAVPGRPSQQQSSHAILCLVHGL